MTRKGTNVGSDCLNCQCSRLGMITECPSDETGNSSVAPWSRPMNSACARDSAGSLGESFGDQVVQMLGAPEHGSERIRACVSEERRSQRRRWAAWAPKIRRGFPALSLGSIGRELFYGLNEKLAGIFELSMDGLVLSPFQNRDQILPTLGVAL